VAQKPSNWRTGGESFAYLEAGEQRYLENRQAERSTDESFGGTPGTIMSSISTEVTNDENDGRPCSDRDSGRHREIPVGVTSLIQGGLSRVRRHKRHQVCENVAHHRTGERRSGPSEALHQPPPA
jgi:hypothetical protein